MVVVVEPALRQAAMVVQTNYRVAVLEVVGAAAQVVQVRQVQYK
jgi:hypothetical protein